MDLRPSRRSLARLVAKLSFQALLMHFRIAAVHIQNSISFSSSQSSFRQSYLRQQCFFQQDPSWYWTRVVFLFLRYLHFCAVLCREMFPSVHGLSFFRDTAWYAAKSAFDRQSFVSCSFRFFQSIYESASGIDETSLPEMKSWVNRQRRLQG